MPPVNKADAHVASIIAMYQDPARTPETLAQARSMALGCTSRSLRAALARALRALRLEELHSGRWYVVVRTLRVSVADANELCAVARIDGNE